MTKQNWEKRFKDEFGIHFKDSSGELGFAIAFIEDELTKARKEERKEIIKEVIPEKDDFDNKLVKNKKYSPAELGIFLGRVGYKEGWNGCRKEIKIKLNNIKE